MLQLAPSHPFDSNLRPVALRMRPDLVIRERRIGSRRYYVIKDPIRLSHHQLWEEEFVLLKMLDGRTSLAAMKDAFTSRFPGARLDVRLLQILHGQFYRNGLVLSEHLGQADELRRRNESFRFQEKWGRVRRWMSIRFRGFNPDSILDHLDQRIGWCFELPSLIVIALFLAFTLISFAGGITSIPSFDEYLTVQTIALLYLAFSGLKVLHEIGHGIACKHFGGECNEMGLMLLVFTPCLYCDVTDSWMVDSKWKRAMIASAGILFELIAAAICMWMWWFTNPGVIHSLCFQIALVGSVGTMLFNGNPLLKYDGYFVVADLLDRPNLSQQARRVLGNGFAGAYLLRAPQLPADYSGRGNGFLWMYGVLADSYRVLLSFVILFVVFKFFQLMRLELVGLVLVCSALIGWLYSISNGVGTWVSARGGVRNLRKGRVSLTLMFAILLVAAVVWLPLPTRLYSHAFIEVQGARTLTVLVDGKLKRCQPEGASVRAGDEVATFVSEELELSLIARRGELARQRARLMGLESRRGTDPLVASLMPAVVEAIKGLELEVLRLESDIEQLTLRAPTSGIVLAPLTIKPTENSNDVQTWSGLPMNSENIGCVLHRGTPFCEIGDSRSFQGTVYLSQSQVELVEPSDIVFLKSSAFPTTTFRGVISEVGTATNLELPSEVATSGIVPSRMNRNGRLESSEPVFLARIEIAPESLEGHDPLPLHHSIARVAIHIRSQSIGERVARFVFSTFTIDPTVKQRLSL
jgi:putative peptide zinc metalloprotease protein